MTAKKHRKILVTGATGRQGGAVVKALMEHGHRIRIMTRTPEKAISRKSPNVEVVRGDFRDPESLEKALAGVDGAFVMSTPYEEGTEAEAAQGKAMVDACAVKITGHVVYSSISCADRNTGIPHFDSKYRIEEHLKRSGLDYTIVRPVWFMENFASPRYLPSIERGVLSTPLHPKRILRMVSVADIGRIVAHAFTDPSRYKGRELDVAGDEMDMDRIARELSLVRYRRIRYDHIPEAYAEEAVGRDEALMFQWLNEHGWDVDAIYTRNRFEYYGVPLTSFRQYLGQSPILIRDVA